jgi:quercetin dioxygenase-like cupin family protein
MMKWKIIEHDDENVTIEFDDGSQLRWSVEPLLRHIIDPPVPTKGDTLGGGTGLSMGGAIFKFEKDGYLAPHAHDESTNHDIEVKRGTVRIEKDSGDVTALAGTIVRIAVNERHAVRALTPALTVHITKKALS